MNLKLFWTKVTKTGNCWLWNASLNEDGYGQFYAWGKTRKAHQCAFILKNGPVPEGLEIDHLCGTRSCVNPNHLEAVTHRENVRRGKLGATSAKRQLAKTHCKKGHEYTIENTYTDPKIYGSQKSPSRHCKTCRLATNKKWLRGEK